MKNFTKRKCGIRKRKTAILLSKNVNGGGVENRATLFMFTYFHIKTVLLKRFYRAPPLDFVRNSFPSKIRTVPIGT